MAKTNWVSTAERLPQNSNSVPVLIRRNDLDGKLHVSMGYYKHHAWWYRMPGTQYIIRHPVEFWLPLPEFPNE